MISSMTGFGRGEAENHGYRAVFEVTSLNSRYLEASVRTPRWMMGLEQKLRTMIGEAVGRGKVVAQLSWERTSYESSVQINEPLAASYIESLRRLGEKHRLGDTLTIGDLMSLPDFWITSQSERASEQIEEVVTKALLAALTELKATRAAEGQKLGQAFLPQLEKIRQTVARIRELADGQVEHYREKLTQRIEELFGSAGYDPQRLAQEVAYMAERADITEECLRLEIHCRHFQEAVESDEPVGRRLNFLMQELNREVNTIGSKSVGIEISKLVVDLKDELERIREQVQNVE